MSIVIRKLLWRGPSGVDRGAHASQRQVLVYLGLELDPLSVLSVLQMKLITNLRRFLIALWSPGTLMVLRRALMTSAFRLLRFIFVLFQTAYWQINGTARQVTYTLHTSSLLETQSCNCSNGEACGASCPGFVPPICCTPCPTKNRKTPF